jgi:hypothetical protein
MLYELIQSVKRLLTKNSAGLDGRVDSANLNDKGLKDNFREIRGLCEFLGSYRLEFTRNARPVYHTGL